MQEQDFEYAGFWIRTGASLIDTLLIGLIIIPLITMIYGFDYWDSESEVQGFWDFLLSYIFPIVVVIVLWIYKSATPGKMATQLIIVDAKTGGKPSLGQFVIRYIGYYVAILPLCLGIIWVGFDKRKQGWHDKMAGTVVIRNKKTEAVKFEG